MSTTEKTRFAGGASLTDPPEADADLLHELIADRFRAERHKENLRELDAIRWRLSR